MYIAYWTRSTCTWWLTLSVTYSLTHRHCWIKMKGKTNSVCLIISSINETYTRTERETENRSDCLSVCLLSIVGNIGVKWRGMRREDD